MDVVVIGAGIVGAAFIKSFKTDTVTCHVIDPLNPNSTSLSKLESEGCDPEFIFFCLPTPGRENGSIDTTLFHYYLDILDRNKYTGITVIKSTMTPQHLERLQQKYNLSFVYYPEFIRETSPDADVINPHLQILGGKMSHTKKVQRFILENTTIHNCPVYKTDITTASLAKYFINAWLATKVVFMNEYYKLHKESNSSVDWDTFTDIVKTDPRVGNSHLSVPGPDGEFGFGGSCFPKDAAALIEYAKGNVVNLSVLKQAVEKNKIIRK